MLAHQHQRIGKNVERNGKLPARFQGYRIAKGRLPGASATQDHFTDLLADDEQAGDYRRRWLAAEEPVVLRGKPTGWIVLVQQSYDMAIGSTLDDLKQRFFHSALVGLAVIALVIAGSWIFAVRVLADRSFEPLLAAREPEGG